MAFRGCPHVRHGRVAFKRGCPHVMHAGWHLRGVVLTSGLAVSFKSNRFDPKFAIGVHVANDVTIAKAA